MSCSAENPAQIIIMRRRWEAGLLSQSSGTNRSGNKTYPSGSPFPFGLITASILLEFILAHLAYLILLLPRASAFKHKFCLFCSFFPFIIIGFKEELVFVFFPRRRGLQSQPNPSPVSLCWQFLGFLRSEYANTFLG